MCLYYKFCYYCDYCDIIWDAELDKLWPLTDSINLRLHVFMSFTDGRQHQSFMPSNFARYGVFEIPCLTNYWPGSVHEFHKGAWCRSKYHEETQPFSGRKKKQKQKPLLSLRREIKIIFILEQIIWFNSQTSSRTSQPIPLCSLSCLHHFLSSESWSDSQSISMKTEWIFSQ